MSKIPPIMPPNLTEAMSGKKSQSSGAFDDLFNSKVSQDGYANDLLANILGTSNDNFSAEGVTDPLFPFSMSFQKTFGIAGPLPTWINMITQKLGLSEKQNLALQDIAVRNKDITKTPDNVAKISMELKKAGIGA